MLIILYLFILGIFLGSFLNVLIDRLPREESILGRSHCENCKHTLAWYDLVPIFTYVTLRGRCRYCKKKFSSFYPFIEICTGIIFALIAVYVLYPLIGMDVLRMPFPVVDNPLLTLIFPLLLYLFFGSSMIVIFFADLKYHIIPDSLQVALFLAALGFHLMGGATLPELLNYLGAGVGVMTPILILFLVTKGRGMGFGDVKLAFNMGFLLGLIPGLIALYIGFITGAVAGMFLLLRRKKKMKSHIAFGPYLLIGTLVVFFFRVEAIQIAQYFLGI